MLCREQRIRRSLSLIRHSAGSTLDAILTCNRCLFEVLHHIVDDNRFGAIFSGASARTDRITTRQGSLTRSNRDLATRVAALMSPAELLLGTCTGVKPPATIALPDKRETQLTIREAFDKKMKQLTIQEAFERSVRARR